jgi:hypothetical protein
MMLAWESVVYLLLTIAFEYFKEMPSVQAMLFKVGELPPVDASLKDDDVKAEEVRCADPSNDASSTIIMKDAKKMYPGGKYAVRGMSIGIPNGECFGLLGINGAGGSLFTSLYMSLLYYMLYIFHVLKYYLCFLQIIIRLLSFMFVYIQARVPPWLCSVESCSRVLENSCFQGKTSLRMFMPAAERLDFVLSLMRCWSC